MYELLLAKNYCFDKYVRVIFVLCQIVEKNFQSVYEPVHTFVRFPTRIILYKRVS
jgi:hypothetical protein